MIFSDVLIFAISIVISYLFRLNFQFSPFYFQQIKTILLLDYSSKDHRFLSFPEFTGGCGDIPVLEISGF